MSNQDPSDNDQDLLDGTPEPRPHHYLFAHRVLPGQLWQNPSVFLTNLYGEMSLGFLLTRWCEDAKELDESECIPPGESFRCDFFDLAKGYRVAVISLPEPKIASEAYMVAVVFRPQKRRLFFFKTAPVLRYFTLEYGLAHESKTHRTFLCEWDSQGDHHNYGTAPFPTPRAFVDAIKPLLS